MADMVSASVGRPCAVLLWGVDHSIFFPAASPGEEILCVGDFKAYKRHDLVVEAWLRLPSPRPRLRLVGNPDVDRKAHARLLAQISAAPERESIKLDYRLPHEQMPDIYRRALYRKRDGSPVEVNQVHARTSNYTALFEKDGAKIRLKEGTTVMTTRTPNVVMFDDDDDKRTRARELAIQAAARFTWEGSAADLAEHL